MSCITRATLHAGGPANHAPDLLTVWLNGGVPVVLDNRVMLRIVYALDTSTTANPETGDQQLMVAGYDYTLMLRSGQEIVAYQWHPAVPNGVVVPHVHFGPASARPDSTVRPGELHKVHFPTGIVSLTEVIRLAIEEFHVEPRRSDWDTILGVNA